MLSAFCFCRNLGPSQRKKRQLRSKERLRRHVESLNLKSCHDSDSPDDSPPSGSTSHASARECSLSHASTSEFSLTHVSASPSLGDSESFVPETPRDELPGRNLSGLSDWLLHRYPPLLSTPFSTTGKNFQVIIPETPDDQLVRVQSRKLLSRHDSLVVKKTAQPEARSLPQWDFASLMKVVDESMGLQHCDAARTSIWNRKLGNLNVTDSRGGAAKIFNLTGKAPNPPARPRFVTIPRPPVNWPRPRPRRRPTLTLPPEYENKLKVNNWLADAALPVFVDKAKSMSFREKVNDWLAPRHFLCEGVVHVHKKFRDELGREPIRAIITGLSEPGHEYYLCFDSRDELWARRLLRLRDNIMR